MIQEAVSGLETAVDDEDVGGEVRLQLLLLVGCAVTGCGGTAEDALKLLVALLCAAVGVGGGVGMRAGDG